MELVLYFTLLLVLLLPVFIFCTSRSPKRVPPGSLGLPLIGQSLSLMKAMRANKGKEWFQDRIRKNGPISKLSLFGYPTVLLQGQAANKFIYTCDGSILANKQPTPISRILGVNNILELSGDDHKRVRAAILSFLKPEVLKQYVEKLDQEIRHHLNLYNIQVAVVTSMTHMEESIFPHPSTFDPTRFEKQAPAPPFSFVAFGGGPRMCPGFEFAKMETLAMIHHLVTRFTWKLSLKENAFRREPMPVFPEGLPVQILPNGITEIISEDAPTLS